MQHESSCENLPFSTLFGIDYLWDPCCPPLREKLECRELVSGFGSEDKLCVEDFDLSEGALAGEERSFFEGSTFEALE